MIRAKLLFNKVKAISWLLLLLLVSSCETGSNESPGTDGVAEIGPDGGIIAMPDGCKLEIPAGALDSEVKIEIVKADGTATGASFAGSIYEFKPHGLQFVVPVTVTIPFDVNEYDSIISKLKLLWAPSLEGPWEALEESVVNSSAGTVTGQTLHFSFFSAGYLDADTRTDAVVCGSAECGTVDDNYGVARACGTCTGPYTCQSNMCAIDCGNPTTMYSCRATQYSVPVCVDYPTGTWTCGEAFISCSEAAEMGGGQIDTWSDTNCAEDNFYTIWRCHATSDGEVAVPVYYIYAEVMPLSICTGVYFGTVVERDGDTWQGYDSGPDGGLEDGGVGDGGLVAYYPFNGNANDESGNGNNGAVHGAILTEDRFENSESAYAFDGYDDYISRDFNLASGMFPTEDPFTVVAWFNTSADSPEEQVIVSSHNAGCCDGYHVCIDAFNESRLRCFFNIYGEDIPVYSTGAVNDGQWHNVVCMWSDNLIRLYIDGELNDSTEAVGSVEYSSEVPFKIGHSAIAEFEDDYYHFSGVLDDVRLYARPLSVTEVKNIYHEGGWAD